MEKQKQQHPRRRTRADLALGKGVVVVQDDGRFRDVVGDDAGLDDWCRHTGRARRALQCIRLVQASPTNSFINVE